MAIIRNGNIISGLYLLLTGISSLFYLSVIIIQQDIDGIFWLTIPICFAIAIVTIITNFKIIKSSSAPTKKNLLINLFIISFQVINVSFNGFQFKFNQGLEVVFYLNVKNITNEMNYGFYFANFNYFLNIKFITSEYFVVGVNVLPLILFLFFLFQYNNLKNVS